jgi:hypothetical protein
MCSQDTKAQAVRATKVDGIASDEELRSLAEDLIKHCPTLSSLLLHMGNPRRCPLRTLADYERSTRRD